jgi:hypothetical protein
MAGGFMQGIVRSATLPQPVRAISKWEWSALMGMVVLSGCMLLVSVMGEWRDGLHGYFHPPYRTVLSKASGDFMHSGVWLDILKIQSDEGLFVEVYAAGPKQASKLVERLKLTGTKDAYFHSRTQATRMVIEDIDGSGSPSIVVPSFDDDLVAHINVFKILENGQTQQVASND